MVAAEAVGVAIGVVGILGQLFDGCVKAYGYFNSAANLDVESQRLLCKVRIEEMRLLVWGREWGVTEGRLEMHLKTEATPQMRDLATQIMRELHAAVTDVGRLKDRYGLMEEDLGGEGESKEKAAVNKGSATGGDGNGNEKEKEGKGQKKERDGEGKKRSIIPKITVEKSWPKEIRLRSRWVISDKEKFNTLLGDLKDFNDGLERLFPPSRLPSIHRAWAHQLLETAHRSVAELSLLEKASDGIYPRLNTSASLKKLRVNLDSKPQSSFKPTFAFRVPRTSLTLADTDPVRSSGFYEQGGTQLNVVVEWVDYNVDAMDERFVHLRRLDDLARLIHSASDQHPDLHTVDCLGYTDDTKESRYGLIYKAPAASSNCTLHQLVSSPDLKTPDLDERVRLAQTLAVALWSLHSLDWLHKSLCSSNILFFPSPFSPNTAGTKTTTTTAVAAVADISSPVLVGFDASRPDLDTDMSVSSKHPSSVTSLHRHPESLSPSRRRPYCKSFDIYSLGLVLLEIGLWKVLQTYHRPQYSAERWRDKIVLPVLVPGLGSKVGRLYRSVVEKCLTVDEDISSQEASQFMESIVATLESIRV